MSVCPQDQATLRFGPTARGPARRCGACPGELHTVAGLRRGVRAEVVDALLRGARGGPASLPCRDCGEPTALVVGGEHDLDACVCLPCALVWLPRGSAELPAADEVRPKASPRALSRLSPGERERLWARLDAGEGAGSGGGLPGGFGRKPGADEPPPTLARAAGKLLREGGRPSHRPLVAVGCAGVLLAWWWLGIAALPALLAVVGLAFALRYRLG